MGSGTRYRPSSLLEVCEQYPQGGEEEKDGEFAPCHRQLRQRMVAGDAVAVLFGQLAAVGAPEDAESFHAQTPCGMIRLSNPSFGLGEEASVSLSFEGDRTIVN